MRSQSRQLTSRISLLEGFWELLGCWWLQSGWSWYRLSGLKGEVDEQSEAESCQESIFSDLFEVSK